MEGLCGSACCEACPGQFVCRCLQLTEEAVVEVVTRLELRTLQEVREHTGAGTGCNACHRRLRDLIDRHAYSASAEPICSVR